MRSINYLTGVGLLLLAGCGSQGAEQKPAAPPASPPVARGGGAPSAREPGQTSSVYGRAKPETAYAEGGVGLAKQNAPPARTPSGATAEPRPEAAGSPSRPAVAKPPPTPEPQPAVEQPPTMPEVNLGEGEYAQSTRLKVGDAIPAVSLPDVEGKTASLDELRGDNKLLVLVFWDSTNVFSTMELRYLEKIAGKHEGVPIVAINRSQSADAVRAVVEKEKLSYPVLLDGDSAVFNQFATAKLPRTYLVDRAGKILWLEVTFSGQGTIRKLQQAIAAGLAQ